LTIPYTGLDQFRPRYGKGFVRNSEQIGRWLVAGAPSGCTTAAPKTRYPGRARQIGNERMTDAELRAALKVLRLRERLLDV